MVYVYVVAVAGVSADELVARGRRAAESLMTDVVLVSRASGRPVTDPVTGVVSVPSVEVYEGIGRVQGRATEAKTVDGVQVYILSDLTVQLPVSVEPVVDDEVRVVESLTEPHLVGRTFRVKSAPRKSHATMTRCEAEEVAA